MNLYPYQVEALELIKDKNRCAIYYDMGLGKTYIGSEKMKELGSKINLVICQKSKIDDWVKHLDDNYNTEFLIFDLTNKIDFDAFMSYQQQDQPYERTHKDTQCHGQGC
jgi:superfamily II DNA or RNA helicase